MTGTSEAAQDFDPTAEPYRENPFGFFSWARHNAPVTYVPALRAWMVSRYEDVIRVLDDTELFSSHESLPVIDRDNPPEVLDILSQGVPVRPTVVQLDPPQHTRRRAIWRRMLRGTRITAHKPHMYQLAQQLVDTFAGHGNADLVEQFAQPFILQSVCALVGIPEGDHERVGSADRFYIMLMAPNVDAATKHQAAQQYVDFDRYLLDLLQLRRRQPVDDMLTELTGLVDDPHEPFDTADALTLIRSVFAAGTHTPVHAISAALHNTLADRVHWQRMLADPSAIALMIEESLRRDAPHRGLMRTTTRDTQLHDVRLPAGSIIFPMLGSANRDSQHFREPDSFQPTRDRVRTHVAFGHGPHDCVGEHLARTQAHIAFEVLTSRLPDLRLAPGYIPAHQPDWFVWGLARLDVTFTPAHP
jgi:cytochrome P450